MTSKTRRTFMKSAAIGAASTYAAPAIVRGNNLNSKIRVVVVGMGGRASSHTTALVELEKDSSLNVELAGICDCDTTKLGEAINVWGKRAGHALTPYDDMRRAFDDKSIDAVTFATPNHWHSLGTIWGCQAGKDVYVEKPGSHNIFEGRKMVEAARKYNRIVQHGTQCRSSANIVEGIQKLHQGVIGEVYFARGIAYKVRPSHGKKRAWADTVRIKLGRLVRASPAARIQQFQPTSLALDLGFR